MFTLPSKYEENGSYTEDEKKSRASMSENF